MKLTRSNFGELLTPVHEKIFWQSYKEKKTQYDKLFNTSGKMKKKDETYPHMGAFGIWDENTEGNTINEDEMNQGPTATIVAKRFDKGYSVTWELVKDDLYGVMGGRGKDGTAKNLGAGLRRRIETDCANIINNGFANVGYDGVALFSASHPLTDSASLLDNLLSGALTPANLKTGLTKVRNQVDEAGNKIQAVGRQLFTGPDYEFTAKEVTASQNQAFEQSNTKNVIEGVTPVVLDYITGSTWGLRDPDFDNLVFKFRESPFFDSKELPKTVDYFMFGFTRYGVGYVDIRGLAASTGL